MRREPLLQPGPPRFPERRLLVRVQERLNQSGAQLEFSGVLDDATRRALGRFQRAQGLKQTRKADCDTLMALGLKRRISQATLV